MLLQIISSLVIGVVLWEHFGRIFSFYQPSVGLAQLARWAIDFFRWLGEWIARLSSYLIHLKLDEIVTSIEAVLKPVIEIAFSWFYFFEGYFRVAWTYSYPILVTLGSLLVLVLVGWALTRWNLWPARIKDFIQLHFPSITKWWS